MERALAHPTGLRLDAKRIAATSVAILVHAAVLMLLLMPTRTRIEPVAAEQDMIVVPEFKPIEPIVPPTPPEPHPVAPEVRHRPTMTAQDTPAPPVDDSPSPNDIGVPPLPPLSANDFGTPTPAPVFAQIAADLAPVPPYPRQAIARRLSGEVVLRIRVDAQGRPVEVTVETSSGSPLLDEAAAKFVKARWHFVPATQDGRPVEALALLPINYSLPR